RQNSAKKSSCRIKCRVRNEIQFRVPGLKLRALVVLCREEICSKENHSALSRCFLFSALSAMQSSSTGFSPARGKSRCKNTWTCTASFLLTRVGSISRKKISRPKADLSRGENISMSHGPNGRTWNRFSSWSKRSRPAGTRNRSEGREQHYAISRTKRDADPGRARDAGRRTAASLLAPDRHRNGYLRRESGEVRSDPW